MYLIFENREKVIVSCIVKIFDYIDIGDVVIFYVNVK